MPKPIILAIDDDQSVLSSVERDLRARFGRDYRIVALSQGRDALDLVNTLPQRNETIALFLADQRMPEMAGTEFLAKAIKACPTAKRVLLTAYADSQAAIDSINEVGLDYYLMKPWHPPEERLYPVLDELLDDWKAHARLPYEGIRVAGTLWSPTSHEVKDFLTRHQIPYQWLDVEKDSSARKLVEEASPESRLPVLFFPDGTVSVSPDLKALAEKVGLQTCAGLPFYDLIVIGSGPAGLAAAVYAGSEGLKCLVIEKSAPGGQAGSCAKIENYLGFPAGISGDDLARRAVSQAKRFGVEILSAQEVRQVSVKDGYRLVSLSDGTTVSCHALLVATGASFRRLKVPGASDLCGAGIYYGAAYTEAMNYPDQEVFVIGGANSAAQGALYLSRFARKVRILIRTQELTASNYLCEALSSNEKIEILRNSELSEVRGNGALEQIVVQNVSTGEEQTFDASALFVFIGVEPQSGPVRDLVRCNSQGQILTGLDLMEEQKPPQGWPLERDPLSLETSVPGVFAAGDVRQGANPRVSSAVGEGAMAYALIKEYLKTL